MKHTCDMALSVSSLVSKTIDYLYENLADKQRELALLPSSYDALTPDADPKAINAAAEHRRAQLLSWTRQAISILTQLLIVIRISTSSNAADAHTNSMAGISAAIKKAGVAISELDAADKRYVSVLNAIGSIPSQMSRSTKPRYAIETALHVFKHGALPLQDMPVTIYRATEDHAGVNAASLLHPRAARIQKYFAETKKDVNGAQIPAHVIQRTGPAFPRSMLSSLLSRNGIPAAVAHRLREQFAYSVVGTNVGLRSVSCTSLQSNGLFSVESPGIVCYVALLPSGGASGSRFIIAAVKPNANKSLSDITTPERRLTLIQFSAAQAEQLQARLQEKVDDAMSQSMTAAEVVQVIQSELDAVSVSWMWDMMLLQLTQAGAAGTTTKEISQHYIDDTCTVKTVYSHRNMWSGAGVGVFAVKNSWQLPSAPPAAMLAAEYPAKTPTAAASGVTESKADDEDQCDAIEAMLNSIKKYAAVTASDRFNICIIRKLLPPAQVLRYVSDIETSDIAASQAEDTFIRLKNAAVALIRRSVLMPTRLQPTDSGKAHIVIDESQQTHNRIPTGAKQTLVTSLLEYLGLHAVGVPRHWSDENRRYNSTQTTKTGELMGGDLDFTREAPASLASPSASAVALHSSETLTARMTATFVTLSPATCLRMFASINSLLYRVSTSPSFVSAQCEVLSNAAGVKPFGFSVETQSMPRHISANAQLNIHGQYFYTASVASAANGRTTSQIAARQPFQRQVDQAIRAVHTLAKQATEEGTRPQSAAHTQSAANGNATSFDDMWFAKAVCAPPLSMYFSALVTACWSRFHLMGLVKSPLLTDRLHVTGLVVALVLCADCIHEVSPDLWRSALAFIRFALPKLTKRFTNAQTTAPAIIVAHMLSPVVTGKFLDSGILLDSVPPMPAVVLTGDMPAAVMQLETPQPAEASRDAFGKLLGTVSTALGAPIETAGTVTDGQVFGNGICTNACLPLPKQVQPAWQAIDVSPSDRYLNAVAVVEQAQLPTVQTIAKCIDVLLSEQQVSGMIIKQSNTSSAAALSITCPSGSRLLLTIDPVSLYPVLQVEGAHGRWANSDISEQIACRMKGLHQQIFERLRALYSRIQQADEQLSERLTLSLRTQKASKADVDAPQKQTVQQEVRVVGGTLNPFDAEAAADVLLAEGIGASNSVAAVMDGLSNVPMSLSKTLKTYTAPTQHNTAATATSSICRDADQAVRILQGLARAVRRPAGFYGGIDPGQIVAPLASTRDFALLSSVSLVMTHYCDLLAIFMCDADSNADGIAALSAKLLSNTAKPQSLIAEVIASSSSDASTTLQRLRAATNACSTFQLSTASQIFRCSKAYQKLSCSADTATFTLSAVLAKAVATISTLTAQHVMALIQTYDKPVSEHIPSNMSPLVYSVHQPRIACHIDTCKFYRYSTPSESQNDTSGAGTKRRLAIDADEKPAFNEVTVDSFGFQRGSTFIPIRNGSSPSSMTYTLAVSDDDDKIMQLLVGTEDISPVTLVLTAAGRTATIRYGGSDVRPLVNLRHETTSTHTTQLVWNVLPKADASKLIVAETSPIVEQALTSFDGQIAASPDVLVAMAPSDVIKMAANAFQGGAVEAVDVSSITQPVLLVLPLPGGVLARIIDAINAFPQFAVAALASDAVTSRDLSVLRGVLAALQHTFIYGIAFCEEENNAVMPVLKRGYGTPFAMTYDVDETIAEATFSSAVPMIAVGTVGTALKRAALAQATTVKLCVPLPHRPQHSTFCAVQNLQAVIEVVDTDSNSRSGPTAKRARASVDGHAAPHTQDCIARIIETLESASTGLTAAYARS